MAAEATMMKNSKYTLQHSARTLALTALLAAPLAQATPLIDSIRSGDYTSAAGLIRSGTDINVPEANGTTPLHWAVHYGNHELATQLIAAGADVNASNAYGS